MPPPLNLANFKLPEGSSSSPAPTSNSMLPPLDLKQFKLGYSMAEKPPDTLTPAQQINQNFHSGKISAPDAVIQDVGEAAQQTNDALLSPWSPLGWISKAVGGATDLVAGAAKAVVDPLAKAAGSAARNVVGAKNADKIGEAGLNLVAGEPGSPMRGIAKDLQKTFTSPGVVGDIGAVGKVANLAATVVGSKEAVEAAPELRTPGSISDKAITAVSDNLQNRIVEGAKADWQKPTTVPKATYGKATDIFENAETQGHNIPDTLVKNGIKLADNVENGNYSTGDAAERIRADAGKTSAELLRPSLQMADYTTPKTPVKDILATTLEDIRGSKGVTPGDMETQITRAKAEAKALQRKYPEGMGLTDMHDNKITYAKNGRYSPVGDTSVNNTAGVNRAFGRTLGGLVETKAPEGVMVKEFNAELQKQYQAADYLDALDTKKVPVSIYSRIAKTAAKVAGAAVGDGLGGGILGGVGGYHLGGMIESMLETMPNPVKGHFLNNLEMTNPKAFDAVKEYLGNEQMARLQRRMLPAPKPLGSAGNPYMDRSMIPTQIDPQAPRK